MRCPAQVRGQQSLFPIVIGEVPPWRLCDGGTAVRSKQVQRVREHTRFMWAVWWARDIDGWPHWPGGSE